MTDTRRTEQVHPDFPDLDRLPPHELIRVLAADQQHALDAVTRAAPALSAALEAALPCLQAGGRLIYADKTA